MRVGGGDREKLDYQIQGNSTKAAGVTLFWKLIEMSLQFWQPNWNGGMQHWQLQCTLPAALADPILCAGRRASDRGKGQSELEIRDVSLFAGLIKDKTLV